MNMNSHSERLGSVDNERDYGIFTDGHSHKLGKRKIELVSGLSGQASFPRKRSVTACQLCRNRKTKCDNQRPICSKCRELGAQCAYPDQANPESPANQILDRLEYLIKLVESGRAPNSLFTNSQEDRHHITLQATSNDHAQREHARNDVLLTNLKTSGDDQDKDMRVPGQDYYGCSEDIFGWPIFEGKHDRRWIEALIFDPTLSCDDLCGPPTSPQVTDDSARDTFEDPRLQSKVGSGVREEDVPHLVETFLLNVHVKNPIFDPEYLRGMARTVIEEGFDWKAPTCLVLIVCALGAISSSFTHQPTSQLEQWGDYAENSLSKTPRYYTAELFYAASRKRIGLLRNTILATECYFMAGVYEMYSLRPLQAAISFNRACVTFQTLTWMNSEYSITESHLGKARASRLYWSCLKSEHETSVEFRFPSSGLTKLNYTNYFPSPPQAKITEDLYRIVSEFETDPSAAQSAWTQNELEIGWYYYLADIAARGLLRRVIKSFYERSESAWLKASSENLLQTAEELDRQLTEWYRTLPDVISFDLEVAAHHELAYHLQARAFEIKERIYRPFLYLMIHKNMETADRESLRPMMRVHAMTCSKLIQQWNVQHRHHGTWLMARQSFASALLLLAARKAGFSELPDGKCEESVQSSISTLRFWEAEAPDLKAARLILEGIVSELHEPAHTDSIAQ